MLTILVVKLSEIYEILKSNLFPVPFNTQWRDDGFCVHEQNIYTITNSDIYRLFIN
jgi:hypothetical protein